MKKLIKKGLRGITIGGKPLYGYYYSSAKAAPGKVDENGFQELAEVEVYRPNFYNDISLNAPWLFNYIHEPGYREYPEEELNLTDSGKKYLERVKQEDEERRIALRLNRKRNIAALWNVAGRPTVELNKNAPYSSYNGITNHVTLTDKNRFIAEISHPIESKYFKQNVFSNLPHTLKLIKNRISRDVQLAFGKSNSDIFKERKPEDDEYSEEYKYAPYSQELRTHNIIQDILYPFVSRYDILDANLRSLSDPQKYLLYDNLRNEDESLYEKFKHLSKYNEVAEKLANKLKEEKK